MTSLFLKFKKSLMMTAAVLSIGAVTDLNAISLTSSKPQSFADVVEPLLPSTVNIWTSTEVKRPQNMGPNGPQAGPGGIPGGMGIEDLFRQFLEGMQQGVPRKSSSLGSGFLIAQEGKKAFIVTCNHVIDGADEIKITLHNGKELDATVIGRDKRTDIALLGVETSEKLTVASWGDSSKARVGDWVIAIGNPFGLGSTVTTGIISTTARDISARTRRGGADYVSGYIQTDASINMGNSGGAMFDIDGKVLGINTAIYSPNGGNIGIGFAIPAALAEKVVMQLKQFGRTKRGWLGVRIQNVTDEIAETLGLDKGQGALVGDVAPKGPGQAAGLQTQDVILSFGGIAIKESKDLPQLVGETKVGDTVNMDVWRGGKKITLKATIAEWEKADAEGLIYDNNDPEETKKVEKQEQTLGLVTRELSEAMRDKYKFPADTKGVFVTFVAPSSEAFEKYIRPGDVIQQLTSGAMKLIPKTPKDMADFIAKIKAAGKTKVLFLMNTKGNLRYVALDLKDSKKSEDQKEPAKK